MNIPQIKMVPIESLTPSPSNPRFITDPRFEKLCKGLQECPGLFIVRPCLASDRTGKPVIYAGNMRYRGAVHLGWTEVPVIIETLTEAEEKQRTIRDNVELGEWQADELANGWDRPQLEEWGLDFSFDLQPDETPEIQEKELRPYKHVNIFISIPIDRLGEIEEPVSQLKNIEGAYYEQSAN